MKKQRENEIVAAITNVLFDPNGQIHYSSLYYYIFHLKDIGDLTSGILNQYSPDGCPIFQHLLLNFNSRSFLDFNSQSLTKLINVFFSVENLDWNLPCLDDDRTILHNLCNSNGRGIGFARLHIAEELLKRNHVNVNACDSKGFTPLMLFLKSLASMYDTVSYFTLMKFLKHPKLLIHIRNNAGQSAYDISQGKVKGIVKACLFSHKTCDRSTLTLACIIHKHVHKDVVKLFCSYSWATRHDWNIWAHSNPAFTNYK